MPASARQARVKSNHIVVLGLGGGGGAVVHQMLKLEIGQRLTLAAADTDHTALEQLDGVVQVPMGSGWNCEAGCGGDVVLGERAAAAAVDDLRALVTGAKLLIVIAGLGGGAGSGGAKIVARLAREENVPAFFFLTFPFAFEGSWLRHQAQETLAPLRDTSDAIMVVQNDLLFTTLSADTPAVEAFDVLDSILARTVAGIAAIAWAEWMLKADFTTISRILSHHPQTCSVGIGSGSGSDRWSEAVSNFVDCPLIGGADILQSAEAAIITVAAGHDLSVAELRECMTQIQQFFSENARVIVGACANETREGDVQITGIICRAAQDDTTTKDEKEAVQRQELFDASPHPSPKKNKRNPKRTAATTAIQAELPFQEQMLGFFSGVLPTRHHGENLDVPTFQRRGIHLDTGD